MAERAHMGRLMEELAGAGLAARGLRASPAAVLPLRRGRGIGLLPVIAVRADMVAAVSEGQPARRGHAAFVFAPRTRPAVTRLLLGYAAGRQTAIRDFPVITHAAMVACG